MKDRTVAVGTATVKMAATAADRAAVDSMEVVKATTEATEAATDESQPADKEERARGQQQSGD